MQAVGYCRVSSHDQIGGTSLSNQRDAIMSYATHKGIDLVEIYEDPGISGSIPLSERPQGKEMVEYMTGAETKALIITKLDRGFRSASDCLANVEAWEKVGLSLHILNLGGQTIDTATPTGKFFITVMAGAAELERNLIKERCQEGRLKRQKEGKRIGEIPYGWDHDETTNTLVVNNQEAKTIKRISELRSKGMTIRAISEALNKEKIPTKKNGKWSHTQVHRLLQKSQGRTRIHTIS